MTIRDDGCGISQDKLEQIAAGQSGVGTVSMRERVKQLHDTFDIQSGDTGTTLQIAIPRLA